MRFIADGVNIPDELLWAQDEGRVVFFCGAGVSQAKADLPDFNELTRRVLEALRAAPDDDARKHFEALSGVEGVAIADQVFQRLRRSFTDRDIGAKVAQCLVSPSNVDLSAHKTLLRLSKLQTGETRIVTTNFDRLFEKSAPRLASVTRSNLPHLQFNEADWGIVHLHGCVSPDYSGPTADGFILSSAEFGNAYLALGWARDFVKHILERYVAVFVGYSADDPPIRYLLEGLQQSKSSNNKSYAFQSENNEQAIVSWDEKGVEALLYPTEPNDGHRRLWESLEAWAARATNPTGWRKRVFDMAGKGPSSLAPHERGMVAHIVSSAPGAQAFAQYRPPIPAEWLCVFDPLIRYGEPASINGRYSGGPVVDPHERYKLDGDLPPRVKGEGQQMTERAPNNVWSAFVPLPTDYRELGPIQISNIRGHFAYHSPYLSRRMSSLAQWITVVADQPDAVWWAGQQVFIHHEVLDRLRFGAEKTSPNRLDLVVADAWRTIAEYHDLHAPDRDGIHELRLRRSGKAGWHEPLAREYARHFSPKLKINAMWRLPIPPQDRRKLRWRDLVNVDVEYSEAVRTIAVPDEYLEPLMGKLRAALELAEDLERRYSGYFEVASIEADDDDNDNYSRQYKLSGHVIHFVRLLKRLASLNPDAARNEIAAWPRKGRVFERLRVWALGNLDLVPADVFADELLSLSPDGFWPFRGERDLLLGLARRWDDISAERRKRIEARIRKGPRKSKGTDEIQRSAHARLSRLNWLKARGCSFSFDLDAENAKLRLLAPQWKPEYAAYAADSHDGKSGWVRTETDFSAIENLPLNEIIAHVRKIERRPDHGFVSYEPFLGLSQHQPQTALGALKAALSDSGFDASFWRSFLRTDIRRYDTPEFASEIAKTLAGLPSANLAEIALAAASWFEAAGKALWIAHRQDFDALWHKFINALSASADANKSTLVRQDKAVDWATEAINSPAGDLTELLILIAPDAIRDHKGFDKAWLARIEQLLALPGDSRRYALAILGFQLVWLFAHDPTWTKANMLSVLDDDGAAVGDKEAIWAGVFWRAHVPQRPLYVKLRPYLTQLVRTRSSQRSRHTEMIAAFLLAGWMPDKNGERLISSEEMRALLLEGEQEFRTQVLYSLNRWSDDDEGPWSIHVAEFLRDAWPKQKSVRTPEISARLCEVALSAKHNFPEVAGIVSSLVTKVADSHIFIPELRNSEESVAGQYPVEMLGLLYAVLPDNRQHWPWGADTALKTLAERMPSIRSDPRFIELEGRLN